MLKELFGIMACCRGGGIGHLGKIPWSCPEDLANYRTATQGKPLIMGMNTYDSMPTHALENRILYVFTRSFAQMPKERCPAHFIHSWDEFKKLDIRQGCMIGGAQIAELFLRNRALDYFLLTRLRRSYPADCWMPPIRGARKILLTTNEFKIYRYENPSC